MMDDGSWNIPARTNLRRQCLKMDLFFSLSLVANTQLDYWTHTWVHPPRPANSTLFCLEGLFLFRSLSTDPRTLLSKRRIEDFHRAQTVKFVSFTGAFTGRYVVKSVKEACETVHGTPKETCQHATQFDRPCKTACFWWVKGTPKDTQECDPGLCKFCGVLPCLSFQVLATPQDWSV